MKHHVEMKHSRITVRQYNAPTMHNLKYYATKHYSLIHSFIDHATWQHNHTMQYNKKPMLRKKLFKKLKKN